MGAWVVMARGRGFMREEGAGKLGWSLESLEQRQLWENKTKLKKTRERKRNRKRNRKSHVWYHPLRIPPLNTSKPSPLSPSISGFPSLELTHTYTHTHSPTQIDRLTDKHIDMCTLSLVELAFIPSSSVSSVCLSRLLAGSLSVPLHVGIHLPLCLVAAGTWFLDEAVFQAPHIDQDCTCTR
uniref:Uncharacterized protein n=1 Tax=Physcomitrium patens TaxID=3218 RepID=A0A2K1KNU9_PHYPA|nr:hypothetical protein PHYPA_006347 [Physcomitrium patens]